VWRTRHATLVQDVSISADADRAHLPGPRIEGEPPAEDVNAANAQANHWIVRRAEGSDIIVRAIVNIGNLGLAVLQAHRGCPPGCTAELDLSRSERFESGRSDRDRCPQIKETNMPIILWLLGVPLVVVVLLMLTHVI
jgi:hypothetical protein